MMGLPSLGCSPQLHGTAPGGRAVRLRRQNVCSRATPGYFPYHRLHLTSGGASIPELWTSTGSLQRPAPRGAPEPKIGQHITYTSEQLAELLSPESWQLAHGSFMRDTQARLQHVALMLARACARASLLWQHIVASWPAWTASLKYDVEYVVEYAIGVLPACLVTVRAALQAAFEHIRATAAMQQLLSSMSSTAKDVGANIRRLRQTVAESTELASYRLATAPPLQQLVWLASTLASRESSGAATSAARGLTHTMAALTADLAIHTPDGSARDSRGARSSPVCAQGGSVSASTAEVDGPPSRPSSSDPSIDGRLQIVGWLPSGVHTPMYTIGAAAGSSLQHMVMEPLQQAGFISSCGRGPTLAGVIAAASLVLAGSLYGRMQHQSQETEQRMLQQVQLQLKSERLAAQRTRFRRALDDGQTQPAGAGAGPSATSNTRPGAASPHHADAWEDSLPAAGLTSGGDLQDAVPQLDAAAAREYRRFLAGARAINVPMWDSSMVDDLPKVSIKEMQRQTQKIRSAATEEERAAMEDPLKRREMVEQQLSNQLAELSGAPMGRAAREAWRKEQQEKKERLTEQQAGASSRVGSPEGNSSRGGADGDSNPFAVSGDARAKWDADDHLYSEPAPRKGGGFGGFGFGGGQPQQQQSQQLQSRRRKFADEPVDTAALQPAHGDRPGNPSSSDSRPSMSSQPEGGQQQQQQQQAAPAAYGPAEGSPEWEAQVRAEMMKNAAARRARRQQMVQQQPAGQSSTAVAQAGMPLSSQPQQLRGTQGEVTQFWTRRVCKGHAVRPPGVDLVTTIRLPAQLLYKPHLHARLPSMQCDSRHAVSFYSNGPTKFSSSSTMQQTHSNVENVAVAAEQQHTALPPQCPTAHVAAGRISLPGVKTFDAPAAASVQAAGTSLTRLERETALYMLNLLGKHKEAKPFKAPVEPESEGVPDYLVIIKHPMDLKTARDKVRAGAYASMDEWRADMQLILDNCRKYNGEHHTLTGWAEKLEATMERRMEEAVAAAAREVSATQQRAYALGLAGEGAAGGGRPRAPLEAAPLHECNTSAGSYADGGEVGRQARAAPRPAVRQQQQPSPQPVRRPQKRVDMEQRHFDDLEFQAVWKRVVAKGTQAASEGGALRHAANELQRSLLKSEEEGRQLCGRLEEEAASRVAAEQQLTELQAKYTQLQEVVRKQKEVLQNQAQLLLEQGEAVRQVYNQQQQ
ncbi:hypothetical protein COO60DRAFT_1623919 [Scenedesmus sp. NREL 46B-D3]|nr:hypothetical protein COO60DRAFT_1623919 [Scenedesmus sp. NREL 46B-D3]